jgi:hypothetical protein
MGSSTYCRAPKFLESKGLDFAAKCWQMICIVMVVMNFCPASAGHFFDLGPL